jgi:hypothetical protein
MISSRVRLPQQSFLQRCVHILDQVHGGRMARSVIFSRQLSSCSATYLATLSAQTDRSADH